MKVSVELTDNAEAQEFVKQIDDAETALKNERMKARQYQDFHPKVVEYNESRLSISIYDAVFLTDIFLNRLLGENTVQKRDDVNMKKLLRAFKAYYYQKFYKISQSNRSRKRVVRKDVYYWMQD